MMWETKERMSNARLAKVAKTLPRTSWACPPAGDFHLELLIHMVFFDLSAALGALFGQRYVDDLVGLPVGSPEPEALRSAGLSRQ